MILAFTGAGISRASGIPTFSEQEGLRKKLSRYFSYTYPKEFSDVINDMMSICNKAKPNDAHLALAEYNIPIITMNIDNLHHKAGSEEVLPIHGNLPHIILYGDTAPLYSVAHEWVLRLKSGDIFLIIGTSFYTDIADRLLNIAKDTGADIVIINKDSEFKVRSFLEENKDKIESYEAFINRR